MTLSLFIQVLALVLLFLAAIKLPAEPARVSFAWMGMFLWLLSELFRGTIALWK